VELFLAFFLIQIKFCRAIRYPYVCEMSERQYGFARIKGYSVISGNAFRERGEIPTVMPTFEMPTLSRRQ
jgi:hypothetical protein